MPFPFRPLAALLLGALASSAGLLAATPDDPAPAKWQVREAPYRAIFRARRAPADAAYGMLLVLPEFGQTNRDGTDLLLLGPDGSPVPIKVVGYNPGSDILVLAKEMRPGADYQLYFGGRRARNAPAWSPRTSLLLETRRVPPATNCNNWEEMQKVWASAQETDGSGFVPLIYFGMNPYGKSESFASHFTGYLLPPSGGQLLLYTLSSDASFVLVNDRYTLGWPGKHSPSCLPADVRGAEISATSSPIKIDYYQVKGAGPEQPGMVLGWKKEGRFETVPATAWGHPGESDLTHIETNGNQPIPLADIRPTSTLSYGDGDYCLADYGLRYPVPDGWTIDWQFGDGTRAAGSGGKHVFTSLEPQKVTVQLQRGKQVLSGSRIVGFPQTLPAASVNRADQRQGYLDAILSEGPAGRDPAGLRALAKFVLDFGTEPQAMPFARALAATDPKASDPLVLRALLASLRARAQADPAAALDELRHLDASLRNAHPEEFGEIEADILVFGLADRNAVNRLPALAATRRGTDFEKVMKIRAGDLLRIDGQIDAAIAQYRSLAGPLDARRVPVEDRVASIKIGQLVEKGYREEAAAKLREWELLHPMAKLESDFLLLHARVLRAFGRWREALAEIESFEKTHPDDPLLIDAEFYRAGLLSDAGKREEARKIWMDIAATYPKHPLAAPSRDLGKAP